MRYLPPLRRLLLPSLICLFVLLVYRSSHKIPSSYLSSLVVEQPYVTLPGERIQVSDLSTQAIVVQDADGGHIEPPLSLYYEYGSERKLDPESDPRLENTTDDGPHYINPADNKYLRPLLECPITPNRYTNHIRLPVPIREISMVLTGESENEKRSFLNAAILSLPYWSENQYLLVSRVQTDGSLQLNIICEANICYTDESKARPGEKPCTEDDLHLLGGVEGMRCATPPLTINVPPTPAKSCGDGTGILMDVPGFHDPRIFWTGKGEPLMILNTQSRYACFGLWAIDLRLLHFPLRNLLSSNPKFPTMGPLMSYPSLTELTRNPPETRGIIEKNWMMFSNSKSSFIHYDLGPTTRSFSKLLGGGLTTPNLTDPLEQPCLREGAPSKKGENYGGSWHQGTNSLRLILCERNDVSCKTKPENTVFWSLIHHKHKNYYQLPLRYERYFIVWSSTPPFNMLAMSSKPILLQNETAGGWDPDENWDDDAEHQQLVADGKPGKENFATFSYTVSIAYAWGRFEDMPHEKNTGYLDDEVIVGLGVDDAAQHFARIKVQDLLQCLRVCPPRAEKPLDGSGDPDYKKHKSGVQAFSENKFGGDEDVDNKGALGAIEEAKKAASGDAKEGTASTNETTTPTTTSSAAATTTEEPPDIQSGAAMVADLPENLRAIYAATGELPVAFHDKNHDKRPPVVEAPAAPAAPVAPAAAPVAPAAAPVAPVAPAGVPAPVDVAKEVDVESVAAPASQATKPGAGAAAAVAPPAADDLGKGTDVQGLSAGEVAEGAAPPTVADASDAAAEGAAKAPVPGAAAPAGGAGVPPA